ncbi:UNVERIFIED_CONTAM: hypothetical protein Sradi_3578500 [Sesamum radiatum]|uniref:Uncharacterized protein n=1 Tax=Sesamum radiatum TaxID=300843 RepID=A0AAW2QG71_SESRA
MWERLVVIFESDGAPGFESDGSSSQGENFGHGSDDSSHDSDIIYVGAKESEPEVVGLATTDDEADD